MQEGKPTPHKPQNRDEVLQVATNWHDPSLVTIHQHAIEYLPKNTITKPFVAHSGDNNHFQSSMVEAFELAIVLGSINYMFWSHNEQGEFVRYQHHGLVGALAMFFCMEQAWNNPQSPIRRAKESGAPLTVEDIYDVFGPIPSPETRRDILNEILLSPHLSEVAQKAEDLAKQESMFDTTFAAQLAHVFPLGYQDPLLKKAQLTTSCLWREALKRGHTDIKCSVTAFADYQIPRVLRAMGILEYDTSLASVIDEGKLIEAGSNEERSLRASSILAIEELSKHQEVEVADVDYWVWVNRNMAQEPFHLTITTLY